MRLGLLPMVTLGTETEKLARSYTSKLAPVGLELWSACFNHHAVILGTKLALPRAHPAPPASTAPSCSDHASRSCYSAACQRGGQLVPLLRRETISRPGRFGLQTVPLRKRAFPGHPSITRAWLALGCFLSETGRCGIWVSRKRLTHRRPSVTVQSPTAAGSMERMAQAGGSHTSLHSA